MRTSGKNAQVIWNEALRQYGERSNALKHYSSISQVLLGFIFISLATIFFKLEIDNFVLSPFRIFLAIVSFFSFALSLFCSYFSYRIEEIPVGPKIGVLLEEAKQDKDLRVKKLKRMLLTNKIIKEKLDKKGINIKRGFIFYLIGFFCLVILKFINSNLFL